MREEPPQSAQFSEDTADLKSQIPEELRLLDLETTSPASTEGPVDTVEPDVAGPSTTDQESNPAAKYSPVTQHMPPVETPHAS